jgi:toxin CcdB
MAQFDVYENPNEETQEAIPYLCDLQSDLLDDLATRVVAPLIKTTIIGKPILHMNPQFEIEGTAVVLSTAELAGVPKGALGRKIGSLKEHRGGIIAAIDFLITGF